MTMHSIHQTFRDSARRGLFAAALLALPLVAAPYGEFSNSQDLNSVHGYMYGKANVLRNGSFEANRSLTEWDGWWEGKSINPSVLEPADENTLISPFEGNRQLAVHYRRPAGTDSATKVMSDFFPLKPNRQYTLTIRYRSQGSANSAFMPVLTQWRARGLSNNASLGTFSPVLDGDGSSFLVRGDTLAPYSNNMWGWATYQQTFNTSGAAAFGTLHLLYSRTPGDEGTFAFDGVSIVEGASPENPAAVTRKYLDGENRLLQTIVENGDEAILGAMLYDSLGRILRTALPVGVPVGTTRGAYYFDALGSFEYNDMLSSFYNPSGGPNLGPVVFGENPVYPPADGYPYSETRYESSPLGRVIEVSGPGTSWKMGSGHTATTAYSSTPLVDDYSTLPAPSSDNGQFFVKVFTSPDGEVTREFTDRMGRLTRRASLLDGNWINTDYAYDGAGNLVEVQAPYTNGSRMTTTKAFDFVKQMTEETTPSTGTTTFLYDDLGRLRFSSTEQQRADGTFSYLKYDNLGRVLETGEILYPPYFHHGNANFSDFPCLDCGDFTISPSHLRVRTMNHYDDTLYSALTCGGTPLAPPAVTAGNLAFLALNSSGAIVSAGYDLYSTFLAARSTLDGVDEGEASILFLAPVEDQSYSPMASGQAIDLRVNEDLRFTVRGMTPAHEDWASTLSDFNEEAEKLGLSQFVAGRNLLGRLAKTTTCNYELADSLDAAYPLEVSKTFRYDAQGNIVEVVEVNGYVDDASQRIQVTRNTYDLQNRPLSKKVCGDLACNPGNSHIEYFVYDPQGRLASIQDKNNQPLVTNYYNAIGQLGAQSFNGAGEEAPLSRRYSYRAQGWLDSMRVLDDENAMVFKETLYYENGSSPRYGGDISRADVALASSVSSTYRNLSYAYQYDDLGRLTTAAPTPTNIYADAAYAYLPDGRLSYFDQGDRVTLSYYYDAYGRLDQATGSSGDFGRNFAANGGHPFVYDESGNLTVDHSKGSGTPLKIYYRPDGLPYLFTYAGGNKIFMAYDESGRRVSKIKRNGGTWQDTKTYFSSGKELREVNVGQDRIFYSMAGVGRVSYPTGHVAGHREAYLTDHLGTTREVYDLDSSKVTYATHYFPYGATVWSSDLTAGRTPTEQFTTKELDKGIELTYFGARYYDQELGVWTSPDPARQFSSVYSYSTNPIITVDPDGRDAIYIAYQGYPVNIGTVPFTNKPLYAPLGHAAVVTVDPKTGNTRYYEYGRYGGDHGKVRRMEVPNLKIDPETGAPTEASLTKLYNFVSERYGKGSPVDASYHKEADFNKVNAFAEQVKNDPNREPYSIIDNNCKTFAQDAVEAGLPQKTE